MTTGICTASLFCPPYSVVGKDLYSKYMERGRGLNQQDCSLLWRNRLTLRPGRVSPPLEGSGKDLATVPTFTKQSVHN